MKQFALGSNSQVLCQEVLNGAIRMGEGLYDRQPLIETDCEFLTRLNLMTPAGSQYCKTEDFTESEIKAIDYRHYLLSSQGNPT